MTGWGFNAIVQRRMVYAEGPHKGSTEWDVWCANADIPSWVIFLFYAPFAFLFYVAYNSLLPEFDEPVLTADGFTVQILNYDPAFTWAGTAEGEGKGEGEEEGGGKKAVIATVAIDATGLVTVTGVEAGTFLRVEITTSREGWYDSSCLTPKFTALTPTFDTPVPTDDGFTVQISNFDAAFTWEGKATAWVWWRRSWDESGLTAAVDETGLLTLTGVPTGRASKVIVKTTRECWQEGSATTEWPLPASADAEAEDKAKAKAKAKAKRSASKSPAPKARSRNPVQPVATKKVAASRSKSPAARKRKTN
jgi:hypothetical protein